MGRTGGVDGDRVFACLCVLGVHLLFWTVLMRISQVPVPVGGQGDALQVTWIEPPVPPVPPARSDVAGRTTTPLAVTRRTDRASNQTKPGIETPRTAAPASNVPLSAVFIEQARRLPAPGDDADAFGPDPLAHRPAQLPGVQADTFRMRKPMSTERVLRFIGGLVAGPGYSTDPCPRIAGNIQVLSQEGDSALLQEELRRKRALCD